MLDFNVAGKFTVDTAEKMISSKDPDAAFSHSYCIHSNDNIKNIIGNISATFYPNDGNSNNNNWLISFGIFIDQDYCKQGIGTQALLQLSQYYINLANVKKLYYVCLKDNANSSKLATKVFSNLAENNENLTFSSKYTNFLEFGTEAFEAILQKN